MSLSIPARRQTALNRVIAAESNLENLRFDLSQDVASEDMERNAERLMDALFADVERMMERGVLVPMDMPIGETAGPVALPPPVEAPPVVVPLESILPPKLAPRDLIPRPAELAEPEPEVPSGEVEPEVQETSELAPAKGGSLLWLAMLCSSLLLSAGILSYLFRDQVTQLWLTLLNQTAQPTATATSPTASPAPQDADFLNYIRQSLDRLAHRAEPEQIAASPSPTLPNPPDASAPPTVERVYVPVYPSPTASPSVSSPARITVIPPTVATAPTSPAVNPSPVAPSAVRPSGVNPPSAAPSAVPNIAAVTHTLIGILALGDRSAALFEINGTPQRVEMGEQIGSSGWILVSINNQEAIVRKNGEVRSIYVGQKF